MFLRELLFDALILVDYSFLEPKRLTELPDMFVRGISMARLMITSEAIQLYRYEYSDFLSLRTFHNAQC